MLKMDNWGPESVEAPRVTLGITGAGPHGAKALVWACVVPTGPASCHCPLNQGWAVFRRLERKGVQRQAWAFCAGFMGSGSEALIGAPRANTSTAMCLPGIQPLAATLPLLGMQ